MALRTGFDTVARAYVVGEAHEEEAPVGEVHGGKIQTETALWTHVVEAHWVGAHLGGAQEGEELEKGAQEGDVQRWVQ